MLKFDLQLFADSAPSEPIEFDNSLSTFLLQWKNKINEYITNFSNSDSSPENNSSLNSSPVIDPGGGPAAPVSQK